MPKDARVASAGLSNKRMFFHTGVSEYILFEQLLTSSAGEMVGACVAIFFLAVLYEGLKVMREQLLKSAFSSSMKYREVTISSQTSQDNIIIDPKSNGFRMLSSSHFIQTALHVVQVFVSYCLMLVFMTYNVWLCLAVILGAGAGYFLFGWKRAVVVDVNEHCH
ncbi:hypothetical protein FSP39_006259 [Pinctada imbricata]|uniref:Copper transport protein n=1 Tax=Pinctada imbricata TaxID=66713 RepID=A0AA89BYL1_PINIB|nr:hypothetical protein FSP39_006259 [Pinctada imbricata]